MEEKGTPFMGRSNVWKFYDKVSDVHSNLWVQTKIGPWQHFKHMYAEYLKLQKQVNPIAPTSKKVQLTLSASFANQEKYDKDNPVAVDITNAIGKMMAMDLQPFSMVQDRGFKELIVPVEPKYSLPDRTTFSRHVAQELYQNLVDKICTKMSNDFEGGGNSIAFITDVWTSRSNGSYLSLTCHYINPSFVPAHYMLGNCMIVGEHSGEAIANALLNLSAKDYARNMKSAIAKTLWHSFTYLGHTLQLAINYAKKETPGVEVLCKKCCAIVEHKRCSQARRLHQIQKQIGNQYMN
ncbi:hypothetical protein PR048_009235 [Dryococelus australis]|uniref:Uncharacterized protein n=1 Tax=Dryococelus australis TaxID=614101 RepID=A0ABQ9I092_9NEOP|nr:hypothetical protein PR048_009235 [Dryococelus australis]